MKLAVMNPISWVCAGPFLIVLHEAPVRVLLIRCLEIKTGLRLNAECSQMVNRRTKVTVCGAYTYKGNF